jgi:hypothetical protein
MKTHAHRIEELRHLRLEADLGAILDALFHRCPTLCGFSVRDEVEIPLGELALREESRLFVTDVSVFPMRDLHPPAEVCSEIVATLVDLMDECPDAGALLRERAFAREFH